ncbi:MULTISPECIES: nitrilase-related carbon-nitrogen hydrolase [Mycolicibacterium]|uniref:Nitrilase/cyanide hydratase and apolipoprotein N-acyltransferase n=1 Tax=Mycolicibacterium senegalense TaxID=1796 RepID=A0A378SX87_9MYCO|nr:MULTISPECIES: nitrilase-related carbon-nitrogen hydrolase [Mycolicibacterium]MCV7334213.1 carbon-nitrogen hydrolase [Mycolicibacterium senegalense]MDR7292269.1 putative amidohydrolase [Mycolicibacterium senegalense]QZA23654.1 carbon-nitrogen hydrolase [Mycolicibacterium senegalense]CDP88514.1 carbon-nitrogen hydrolase [Mycolicibacterium farcinogenes]STZ52545.1 nitrilase/cyanide hydratase and apolipoprotein N-acyltransferase [Mycolicibacterium senegalense]
MSRKLRVSAVSPDIRIGDLDGNLARVRAALQAFEPAGPHVIVLPELATSGYVFASAEEARSLALRVDDERVTSLADAVPADAVAVIGFCEADADRLYNSAVVLGYGGVLGCYRKAHLWAGESAMFSTGAEAGTIVDTPVCRLGVAICYDNEFPELPRRLALGGAEVLALPVNWPLVDRPDGEHAPETVQAMAAARSSQLAAVIADRRGQERGVRWTGGTAVIGADGWIHATPDADGVVTTTVLELTEDKSIGELNDAFADRRPELYRELTLGDQERGPNAK